MTTPQELEARARAEAEAEWEWEQLQKQKKQEAPVAYDRGDGITTIHINGPGYDPKLSGGANFTKGVTDFGSNLMGAADFLSPYNFSNEDWQVPVVEPILKSPDPISTTGRLAAGVAGGLTGTTYGALLGAPLAPFTFGAAPVVTGALGGLLGGAAGLSGFNMAEDFLTNKSRPLSEYSKEFAYNTGAGAPFTALGTGASAALRGTGATANSMLGTKTYPTRKETAVANLLKRQAPGIEGQIDDAVVSLDSDPFGQYKTTAEATQNAGALGVEKGIRANAQTAIPFKEAERARTLARYQALEGLQSGSATMDDFADLARKSTERKIGNLERNVRAAGGDIAEQDVMQFPEKIQPEIAGKIARGEIAKEKALLKDQVSGAYEAAKTSAAPLTSVFDEIDDIRASLAGSPTKARQPFSGGQVKPSAELQSLINDIAPESSSSILDASGNPIRGKVSSALREDYYPIETIQNWYSRAIALSKTGDARSQAVAKALASKLRQSIEEGAASKEAAAFNTARGLRSQQGDTFENASKTKSVLDTELSGTYSLPDSEVMSRYLLSGDKGFDAMQNFYNASGKSPVALNAMKRYIATKFKDVVMPDGKFRDSMANAFRRKYKEALRFHPDLEELFSSRIKAETFLKEEFENLQATKASVEKGVLKFVFDDVDPTIIAEKAVNSLKSGTPFFREAMKIARESGPEALNGFRRGIIEHLRDKVFEPLKIETLPEDVAAIDVRTRAPQTFVNDWKRMRGTLKREGLFTDSQLKVLDAMRDDMASELGVARANFTGSQTHFVFSVLDSLGFYLDKVPSGRWLGLPWMAKKIVKGVAGLTTEGRKELFIQALLKPRIARDLLNKGNTKNISSVLRDIAEVAAEDPNAIEIFSKVGKEAIKTGVKFNEGVLRERSVPPKPPPTQNTITSKKTFPTPDEVLKPAKAKTSHLNALTQARIAVESNNNPYAVSPKGAEGLTQIMPKTGKWIAEQLGETYKPLRPDMDPTSKAEAIAQNIRFSDWYHNHLLDKFNGNATLATAAYNSGPEPVKKALKKLGPNADISRVLKELPPETQMYVKKIAEQLSQG